MCLRIWTPCARKSRCMAEVIVSEAAAEDFRRSARWFEERSPGRGRTFAHAVRIKLTQLSLHPETGPEHYRYHCRRLLIRDFKHGIFYRIYDDTVDVRAIADLRRDPHDLARLLTDRLSGT